MISCNRKKTVVNDGVTSALAMQRKGLLKDIQYTLHFNIPAEKTSLITANESIQFVLSKDPATAIQVDFKEDEKNIKAVKVNGTIIPIDFTKEHLLIAPGYVKKGVNIINISFIAGNSALNRKDDFLYTLFVPDRARTVFPCFDQPDLKAIFDVSLSIPTDWQAIANGALKDSMLIDGKKQIRFLPTDKLPTYLFSFVAGKFTIAKDTFRQKDITFLYRETDEAKIKSSLPEIFQQYKNAVLFNEKWTGIPYPFQKHGMVAIPDFQFGGMEHPGAILLQASTLFLDKEATAGQLNSRSQLLAHEVAHMWFGDLVTMNWFTDVWMKEVFANFMADKATTSQTDDQGFALKFLTDHIPLAYNTDRCTGANPIRQPLTNLNNAGMLYGNIIYHKAPIMMRQLEALMGKDSFQRGVQEYLKSFSYSNASWPDLITILDKHTATNLQAWNTIWVNEPGRPVFDYSYKIANDQVDDFLVMQKPEFGTKRIWPQSFDVSFFYEDQVRTIQVSDSLPLQSLRAALGRKRPLFTVFNSSGSGYGVWPVDTAMYRHLYEIQSPVTRASAYISLYENMLNGRYNKPAALLTLFVKGLAREKTELNLRLLTNYIGAIFWNFTKAANRQQQAFYLEKAIWDAMPLHTIKNNRKILFLCYQNIFTTSEAKIKLQDIWQLQKPPAGVSLSDEDYSSLALSLALRDDNNASLLQEQLRRITNADKRKRFEIVMKAASSSIAVRDVFFNGLTQRANRSNESAIGTALSLLHHPLRQATSIKYLPKTLDLLEEIQKTGDIFFPASWLQNSFGNYQSKSAYNVVINFLQQHSNYNSNLTLKILQASDNMRRCQQLVHP